MNSLHTCKGGTLIPRDPEKTLPSKPTVITYRHTIRQFPDTACNCKDEKERLTKQFEAQLSQKDSEILALVNRVADKETEINQLHADINDLKKHKIAHHTPPTKEQTAYQTDEALWDRMEKTLNSTVISSFSLADTSTYDFSNGTHRHEIQKTQQQMDDCFKKTSILMNDIEGIMKKKRKYEFYNQIHVENSIIEEIDPRQQKQQEDTQEIQMEDTFCLPMSEYNDDQSLDMTTFESVQNFGQSSGEQIFYSKLIQDSINLKNTIIQMREESLQEMRQLEEHYQKQLKISYEELEKERNKNGLIQITRNKLNEISNKGRKALAELDQNEGFNWDVGQKKLLKTSILINENDENFLT